MKLKEHFIISEAAYDGNLGFEELVLFYKKASKEQIKDMEKAIKKGDWEIFKKLINRVVKVNLKS